MSTEPDQLQFADAAFDIDGPVGCIEFYDGKYDPPNYCFTVGWLHPASYDQLVEIYALGAAPKPIGEIRFEWSQKHGIQPRMTVKPFSTLEPTAGDPDNSDARIQVAVDPAVQQERGRSLWKRLFGA